MKNKTRFSQSTAQVAFANLIRNIWRIVYQKLAKPPCQAVTFHRRKGLVHVTNPADAFPSHSNLKKQVRINLIHAFEWHMNQNCKLNSGDGNATNN